MLKGINELIRIRLLTPKGLWSLNRSLLSEGMNLGAILRFSAKSFPARIALTDHKNSVTYAKLFESYVQTAATLQQQYSVRPGQQVALLSRNHISAVTALFALSRLGAHVFLLNAELGKPQLQQLVDEKRFSLLLYDEEPGLENCRLVSLEMLDRHIHEPVKLPKARSGRIAVLTGGTSGHFKVAERKPSVTSFFYPFLALLTKARVGRFESAYIATPIYHSYGLASLIVSLIMSKRIFLLEKYDTEKAAALIRKNDIGVLILVPLMLQRLLRHDPSVFRHVGRILCGGAALGQQLVSETLALAGPKLYNLYGTTEAGFSVMAAPEDLQKHASTIGRKIYGVSMRITDGDRKLEAGIPGQLHLRNRWSMTGRKKQWIFTGDIAVADNEGYIFLRGRADSMIVSGGVNVFPEDIEKVLLAHPEIGNAVVLGITDAEFGQRLKAFIVPEPNSELTEKTVLEWLMPQIARYQVPAGIVLLARLPMTATGKVSKQALMAL